MVAVVKIVRDSRGIKKPKFFNNSKHLMVFVPKDIKFSPAEHLRVDSKIVIKLPKKFSAVTLTKNQHLKKRITKKKRLFLNFINTSFVKTFFNQNGSPIGFLLIENNNSNFEIKHETFQKG